MRETIDGYEDGIQIGGRKLSNLHYADDIILLAGSEEELQELVNRMDGTSCKWGLLIKADKTKVMVTNGTICSIKLQNTVLEHVDTFPYLGSLITSDTVCTKEIRSRFAKGQHVITSLRNIWKTPDIQVATKIRFLKALVWPVVM